MISYNFLPVPCLIIYCLTESFAGRYVELFLYIHCRCRGLLFHLITPNDTQTHTHTHTLQRNHLDEGPSRRRDFCLYNTEHSQQTAIHVNGGIRNRNPSKRTATDPRLRQCGYWDRPMYKSFQNKLSYSTQQVISACLCFNGKMTSSSYKRNVTVKNIRNC